jgi:hypothetical protein
LSAFALLAGAGSATPSHAVAKARDSRLGFPQGVVEAIVISSGGLQRSSSRRHQCDLFSAGDPSPAHVRTTAACRSTASAPFPQFPQVHTPGHGGGPTRRFRHLRNSRCRVCLTPGVRSVGARASPEFPPFPQFPLPGLSHPRGAVCWRPPQPGLPAISASPIAASDVPINPRAGCVAPARPELSPGRFSAFVRGLAMTADAAIRPDISMGCDLSDFSQFPQRVPRGTLAFSLRRWPKARGRADVASAATSSYRR